MSDNGTVTSPDTPPKNPEQGVPPSRKDKPLVIPKNPVERK